MKDCNNCDTRIRCNTQSIQPCVKYVKPSNFKLPILHHLVFSGKVAQAAEVLSRFGIRVVDTNNYPYFKLEYTK
jgi:hypothetical protein